MYRLGQAHPGWVTAWNVFCTVLGPTVFRLVALVVIVLALVRRNFRVAMFLVISVELSRRGDRDRQGGWPTGRGPRPRWCSASARRSRPDMRWA